MDTKTITIDGVLDRDLIQVLEKLQILDQIRKGEISCAKCDKPITLENLGAIRIQDGQVIVYCDDLGCIGQEHPS